VGLGKRKPNVIQFQTWIHACSSDRFRPDLLPSGLYRRPRSFTGSWGLQAFCAQTVARARGVGLGPTLQEHSSASDHPARALPPIGNWEGAQSTPSLTLPRRSGIDRQILASRRQVAQET